MRFQVQVQDNPFLPLPQLSAAPAALESQVCWCPVFNPLFQVSFLLFFFYFVNLSVSVGVTFALSLFTGNDSLMSMLAGAGVHPSSHQHHNHNIQQHISSPAGGVSVLLCINLYTVSC